MTKDRTMVGFLKLDILQHRINQCIAWMVCFRVRLIFCSTSSKRRVVEQGQ